VFGSSRQIVWDERNGKDVTPNASYLILKYCTGICAEKNPRNTNRDNSLPDSEGKASPPPPPKKNEEEEEEERNAVHCLLLTSSR